MWFLWLSHPNRAASQVGWSAECGARHIGIDLTYREHETDVKQEKDSWTKHNNVFRLPSWQFLFRLSLFPFRYYRFDLDLGSRFLAGRALETKASGALGVAQVDTEPETLGLATHQPYTHTYTYKYWSVWSIHWSIYFFLTRSLVTDYCRVVLLNNNTAVETFCLLSHPFNVHQFRLTMLANQSDLLHVFVRWPFLYIAYYRRSARDTWKHSKIVFDRNRSSVRFKPISIIHLNGNHSELFSMIILWSDTRPHSTLLVPYFSCLFF